MSRLIDADALIEDINVWFADSYHLIDSVKERIDAAPTIEQPHWVSCSERLPETNGEYLVTRASANLYCYIDIVKKTNVSGDIANDIVAWMPLPEPYKESKEC